MKRIARVRIRTPPTVSVTTEYVGTAETAPEPDKPRIVAGRVVRSRARFVDCERSTEALDPRRPKPYFAMDWSRSLSWKYSIFLVSSYLYYYLGGRVIISNTEYDRLARELLAGYDTLSHPHKHLCTKAMLAAGTAYNIRDYPRMVVGAAMHALDSFKEVGTYI